MHLGEKVKCGVEWCGFQLEVSKSRRFCPFWTLIISSAINIAVNGGVVFPSIFIALNLFGAHAIISMLHQRAISLSSAIFCASILRKEIYCIENGGLQNDQWQHTNSLAWNIMFSVCNFPMVTAQLHPTANTHASRAKQLDFVIDVC